MKESHYNMYMKHFETLDSTMGHHCAAASITTKKEPQGWSIGKCVKIYIKIFLYLPGAPNSLNPPLQKNEELLEVLIDLVLRDS